MSVSASARHAMPQGKNSKRGLYIKVGIAAGAATALLAGGAGTFAAWNDSTSISGGSVSTGHLTIKKSTSVSDVWYDLTNYVTWLGTPANATAATAAGLPTSTSGPYSKAQVDAIAAAITAGSSAWATAHAGSTLPPAVVDITGAAQSSYLFAPGDTIELLSAVDISAQGNNLQAKLSSSIATSTGNTVLQGGANGFVISSALAPTSGNITSGLTSNGDGTYSVATTGSSSKDISGIPANVVISLPASSNDTSQNNGLGTDNATGDSTTTGNGADINGSDGTALNLGSVTLKLNQSFPAVSNS